MPKTKHRTGALNTCHKKKNPPCLHLSLIRSWDRTGGAKAHAALRTFVSAVYCKAKISLLMSEQNIIHMHSVQSYDCSRIQNGRICTSTSLGQDHQSYHARLASLPASCIMAYATPAAFKTTQAVWTQSCVLGALLQLTRHLFAAPGFDWIHWTLNIIEHWNLQNPSWHMRKPSAMWTSYWFLTRNIALKACGSAYAPIKADVNSTCNRDHTTPPNQPVHLTFPYSWDAKRSTTIPLLRTCIASSLSSQLHFCAPTHNISASIRALDHLITVAAAQLRNPDYANPLAPDQQSVQGRASAPWEHQLLAKWCSSGFQLCRVVFMV